MGTEDKNQRSGGEDHPTQSRIIEENADSYSLNPRLTLVRSLSSMKLRFINYLTKVDDPESNQRFASCNEFTLGINNAGRDKPPKPWILLILTPSISSSFSCFSVIFRTNQCKIKAKSILQKDLIFWVWLRSVGYLDICSFSVGWKCKVSSRLLGQKAG